MLESVRTNSSVREMFCDLSLASSDAVDDDAFDGTNAAITDIAAVDEDCNDLDANNTDSADDDNGDDDDDGDGEGVDTVTDGATDGVDDNDFDATAINDDNDADTDCEINDVVISDVVNDEDGVIILDDDSNSDDRGVVSGTELPTRGCKRGNTRLHSTKIRSLNIFFLYLYGVLSKSLLLQELVSYQTYRSLWKAVSKKVT